MIKCGFVAIIGRPNAGKSSLINAIVNEKVSIVSPKPQTTRNNILGIYNSPDSQIVFVDTPGINQTHNGLDDFMQKSIKGAVSDVNCAILAVDITKGLTDKESILIDNYYKQGVPMVVALTKCDLASEKQIFETLSKFACYADKCEVVPISSLKHKNINTLIDVVKNNLPEVEESQKYFEDDMYTDKPLNFIVAEIVREKALFLLDKEIPHGIAVLTQSYEEEENIVNIDVDIVCDKDTHKAIILGKGGQKLKQIGHNARVTIQKILQKKVNLNLFVKVKPNWKNNLEFLSTLGYTINDK